MDIYYSLLFNLFQGRSFSEYFLLDFFISFHALLEGLGVVLSSEQMTYLELGFNWGNWGYKKTMIIKRVKTIDGKPFFPPFFVL